MSQDKVQWKSKASRRSFLKGAAALAAAAPAFSQAQRKRGDSRLVYVGTYSSPQGPEGSKGNGQGIYLFQMDPSTGALSPREPFADDSNPSWLALDPSRTHLYAA